MAELLVSFENHTPRNRARLIKNGRRYSEILERLKLNRNVEICYLYKGI